MACRTGRDPPSGTGEDHLQRRARPVAVQAIEVASVGLGEAVVVDQVAEQRPVLEERERLAGVAAGGGGALLGAAGVDDLDRLAVLAARGSWAT